MSLYFLYVTCRLSSYRVPTEGSIVNRWATKEAKKAIIYEKEVVCECKSHFSIQ